MKFFIEMRESVINFKFYDGIRKSRYGKVFGYLVLLLLIIYTLSGVKTYIAMNGVIEQGIAYLNSNTPEFSIKDGQLDWRGAPLEYLLQDKGMTVAVDINKTLDENVLDAQNSVYFVFGKESMAMKNNTQKQVIVYRDLNLDITKADVVNLMAGGKMVVVILLILAFPFYYGYKLLNVVLLAAIAAICSSILKVRISWKENFIISGYALTLPLLLVLLFNLGGYSFPWYVYWLISIVYVVMAQRIIRVREFDANIANMYVPGMNDHSGYIPEIHEIKESDAEKSESEKANKELTSGDVEEPKVSDGSEKEKKEE